MDLRASPDADPDRPLRIANCSGFYGDRFSAAREMVEGGPIDVLTGDYLAELTMAILWRSRAKGSGAGFASTFLRQVEAVLGTCLDRGIRIVSNAGGLAPEALAARIEEAAGRLGFRPTVAWVDGDDLLDRLPGLRATGHAFANLDTGASLADAGITPVTANAYLGGRGIAAALASGADVVVTGRVTDAALVIGPSAWHFGWAWDEWDRLAGALVAGHVIECGAQATGGNYAFFREVPGLDHVGFPLVEMSSDGSFVVTKHPGTGGLVSVGTVTAQLLYEIDEPRYRNPDVTARFDTIRLGREGPDRVRVHGVVGEPPPPDLKVAVNHLGGFRNSVEFVLPGLDVEAKARAVEEALWRSLGGRETFDETDVTLVRSDRPDPRTIEEGAARLRVTVKDGDRERVGRRFSRAAVELALAHYPGFLLTAPPADATPYAVYWPTTIPAELVTQQVHVGGSTAAVPSGGSRAGAGAPPVPEPAPADAGGVPDGPTVSVPLGTIAGARSGDKGGNANVGVWVRSRAAYAWLREAITVDRLRLLVPEASDLPIERHELPNLLALNFVIRGFLGEGVAASTRFDPQAKTLAEYLRARLVDVPADLLDDHPPVASDRGSA